MPRRPREEATIEDERAAIRHRYKDGRTLYSGRKARKVTEESELDAIELNFKKDYAIFLKATDYSYTYISDTIGVRTSIIKNWFLDEAVQKKLKEVQADMMDGAVQLLKTYAIEAVEMIMEVARRTPDDKIRISALIEILDRAGMTKVNKSESHVTKTASLDPDSMSGIFDRMEGLPIETQQKLAEMAAAMDQIVEEARGKE